MWDHKEYKSVKIMFVEECRVHKHYKNIKMGINKIVFVQNL